MKKVVTEKIEGFTFKVYPSVFNPLSYYSSKIFSGFILKELELTGKYVLDMGCGSGVLSVIAASKGARCLSVDKNPESVRCTMENASLNGVENSIEAFESDLFKGLKNMEDFDIIFFNPPYYRGVPADNFEMAFKAGEDFQIIKNFLSEAKTRLKKNGKICMIISSDLEPESFSGMVDESGYGFSVVLTKKKLFETFYIFKLFLNL